ncbi:MAG TPA: hypothetical protein VF629_02450 [Hymenobacter sp.]|jgi:hypothetical protein|uniref:hypothetical protein n=1 Tax=Hymenobacter sp. TaxID=1898978 RepID=UPI002ED9EA26
MRFRFLLLLLPVLLSSCADNPVPDVRVDFIGTTTLTSSDRLVAANDTLVTRAFASARDNRVVKRVRITVDYEPGLTPFIYPLPLTAFTRSDGPAPQTLVYVDSLLAPLATDRSGKENLFENRFSARSTSGIEQWRYTFSDDDTPAKSTTRGYRLTVRKSDSLAVFHSYAAVIRPLPRTPAPEAVARDQSRVFLSLRYGLLLPKYALINQEASLQANQQLVDLICQVTPAGTGISLNSPGDANTVALSGQSWPLGNRRLTQLRLTALTPTQFNQAQTTASFTAAFAAGSPAVQSTGALAEERVWAFQVEEGSDTYTGLILVSDIVTGTAPVLRLSVKVQK